MKRLLLPLANEVLGTVMFLHVSVILFAGGGVSASGSVVRTPPHYYSVTGHMGIPSAPASCPHHTGTPSQPRFPAPVDYVDQTVGKWVVGIPLFL